MTIEKAFGAVIRRLRKERGLSQEKLSNISLLDRGFLSNLELGKQQPVLVTVFQIAAALNVPVTRIFSEMEMLLSFNNVRPHNNSPELITTERLWEQFGGKPQKLLSDAPAQGTFLVVDDEAHVLTFLTQLLESYGYTVITAEDGQEAVSIYGENMDCIDMVIMDVMLPRKDGITACREILGLNPQANVLLLSGYPEGSFGVTREFNMIPKPVTSANLMKKINLFLGEQKETLDCAD